MKAIILTITALFSLSLLSCQKHDEPEENTYHPIVLDTKSTTLVNASNNFGLKLFTTLAETETGNLFISPLSVTEALSLSSNGAAGTTAQEMATMLGFPLTAGDINPSAQSVREALLNADKKVEFSIANSLWCHHEYTVHPTFAKVASDYYSAETGTFDPSEAALSLSRINGWVNNQTRGKIPTILEKIDASNRMFVINALYFKGQWQYTFDKKNTRQQPFNNLDGTTSTVEMMHQECNLPYAVTETCSAVELPYGNGHFSMVVMLPNEGIAPNQLIHQLNDRHWGTIINQLKEQSIDLYLPRFKTENNLKLNDALIDMGMPRAFTDEAEFPMLISEISNLCISEVRHKTFVEVGEEGTEAAAVTSVDFVLTSIGDEDPRLIPFIVDRPFVFAIREKDTGAILFIGRMNEMNSGN